VYGDHRSAEPLREDARRVYGPTTQKRWLYADSKAMDEYLALAYRQERELDFVVARLFNTVGPRQSGQYGMVVARFVQAAVAGRPLEIHGDGTQTRTFCHVEDTIRALKGLMESDATTGEIYNVGSRNWISVGELAKLVLELTGSTSELVRVPYDQVYGGGIDDMLHRVPAIEKIRDAIGWEPTRTLEDILSDVIAYERATLVS
jgi:UDP-glucose 4-epimerase